LWQSRFDAVTQVDVHAGAGVRFLFHEGVSKAASWLERQAENVAPRHSAGLNPAFSMRAIEN
jgi:hypothetical protein